MKKTIIAAFAAVIALVIAAVVYTNATGKDPAKIQICRPNNMISAPLYIAEKNGFFKQEGLTVDFMNVATGKICSDSLLSGHTDAAVIAEANFSWLSFSSPPITIVAQAGGSPETTLVARRDRGISHVSDLRGKRVGYLPGTVSYMYLVRMLDKAGLGMKDVTLIALQPPAMPQAIQGGSIDAFVMWEPWADQAIKALGDNAVRLPDPQLYSYKAMINVTSDFARDNPDAVKAVISALIKSQDFISQNPDRAIEMLSEAVKLDPAIIRKNWADYDFTVRLGEDLIQILEADARYIIRDDPNFADKAVPDFRSFIEPKFLRELAPERVTLP